MPPIRMLASLASRPRSLSYGERFRALSRLFPLVVPLATLACAPPSAPKATPAKSITDQVRVEHVDTTDAPAPDKQRGDLDVLVGPENEPVVFRDVRNVALAPGLSRITLPGVPLDLEAGHVGVRTPDAKAPVELVEMRPFGGALTPQRVLEPSLGKTVLAYLWDPSKNAEVAKSATLLAVTDDGPVVAVDGAVRLLTYGRVAVSQLPPTLRPDPAVELLVRATAEAPRIELTYTTRLVKAALEYQLVKPAGSANAELVGLVGVSNETGAALEKAQVSLTSDASETSKFASPSPSSANTANTANAAANVSVPTTRLRLPNVLTLAHGERTLVRLFGPRDVSLTRKVIFEGRGLPFDGTPEEYGNTSVHAVLDARVTNGEALSMNGMIPGRAHLFERGANAPPHAFGTAAARPLPGALGLRVDLGDENKLPSKRKLTQRRTLGRCVIETSWEVTFSNPTEEPLPVEDVEPVDGKYEILDSSLPPIAKEVDHFAFGVTLPPNGEVKLKFRVRTSSCVVQRSHYWQPSWAKPSWSKANASSAMKGGS